MHTQTTEEVLMTAEATTTTTTTSQTDNSSISVVAVADLLVSFAEQNAYLYFNIHTELRELIKRRLFLETYDKENALQLISDVYVPAVIREFNCRDKDKLHGHNIQDEFRDYNTNRQNGKRLSIPQSANGLSAEVRQNISSRLLDWILSECKYLMKEEKLYD